MLTENFAYDIEKLSQLVAHTEDLYDRASSIDALPGETVCGPPVSEADLFAWYSKVSQTLNKVYGKESAELEYFKSLSFKIDKNPRKPNEPRSPYKDGTPLGLNLRLALEALTDYLEDKKLRESLQSKSKSTATINTISITTQSRKVFISHATKDKEIVAELIDLIRLAGVPHGQIFCSSFAEYTIPLGVNYLEWLKKEISADALILYVLSEHFYESPICLAEMGGAWVLSNQHVPLVVPPFEFNKIKGVIPETQGMVINDPSNVNRLADLLTTAFSLASAKTITWERDRNRILTRMNSHLV